jgi:glycosyltransferase involved in cell wall biosynthesis
MSRTGAPASVPSVSLFLPTLEGGGAERVFVGLANEFSALGLRVDLLLARATGPYLSEVASAVRIVDFGGRVLRSSPRLVRHLRRERPDVLLSGLEHSNIVAVLSRFAAGTGTRCVISVRSVPTAVHRANPSVRSWGLLQLVRASYRFADAIIANSQAVAADLAERLHLSSERMHVVYNPLDIAGLQRMSDQPVDHPWCAAGAPPLILAVGSLTPLKDFATLVRAFSLVTVAHPSRLVILGEGPERGALERLIGELGLQQDVQLPGFVRNPFAWMRRAAMCVSSSLTEGCPNALMQALACGTAVVGTDCAGGSAEILEHGKWGRLAAVGDPAAMAQAIRATLDDKAHPDGRRRAHDFAHRAIARQYLHVLLPGQVATDQAY